MILQTQVSYWFVFRAVALHFIFTIFGTGLGYALGEGEGVVIAQLLIICLSSVLLWLSYSKLEHATINKETERIELKDALNRVILSCSLKEIVDMEWENKNVTYTNMRYGNRSTNTKAFVVTFKNGYDWYAEGSDYKNYFEIQGYLLTFCARNQIIKVRPLAERKRSRRRANPFKKPGIK